MNLSQLKMKVNDTFKKDEKITTNLSPSRYEDVINKAYLDTKLSKLEAQISYIQKHFNDFKLYNNMQSAEENVNEKTVKTTIQRLYDTGLIVNYIYANAHELLKD